MQCMIYAYRAINKRAGLQFVNSLFIADSMMSLPDQALLIKLFYMKGELTTEEMHKYYTMKDLNNVNGPIIIQGQQN